MQPLPVYIVANRFQVSILIRPEGRMQRRCCPPAADRHRVSILIRPEGRMQQVLTARYAMPTWFQSSSGQKAGCNLTNRICRPQSHQRFNPHPARRPDATGKQGALVDHASKSFNPHPARRPDATSSLRAVLFHFPPFQSSSGQKAGCNSTSYSRPGLLVWFQSSSGQKAGCNYSEPHTRRR